jgi:hypothetical protein
MGYFFIGLILLTVLYLILWNRGKDGFVTLRVSFGAKKRRSKDVSDQEYPIPPELSHAIGVLTKLKFKPLGGVQVPIPGGRIAGSRIFLSAKKTVFAELTDSNIVLFISVFPDDAVVETGFPVGERITTRDFRSHTITSGLEQAHQHHLGQIEAFGKTHGAPRKIKTMEEYLEWEAMYRRRHVGRKMRRHTVLGFLQVLMLAYGISALLTAIIYWLGSDMSTIEPMLFIMTILVLVLIPAAIIAFFLPYIGDRGSRRETKGG